MARDHVAYLISKTYEKDALNQLIPVEKKQEVFCTIKSLQQSEWFAAGNAGLKTQFRIDVFIDDYAGESLAEVDGVRYEIYRTYQAENDRIELYLEKKAGA